MNERYEADDAAAVATPAATPATLPATATQRRPQPVRRYAVVLHNDDYTTMEFVVDVLMRHFRLPPAAAMHVMLQVHHKGSGVAGTYPRDTAETKAAEVMDEARAAGMPLLLTVEPAAAGEAADTGGEGERR